MHLSDPVVTITHLSDPVVTITPLFRSCCYHYASLQILFLPLYLFRSCCYHYASLRSCCYHYTPLRSCCYHYSSLQILLLPLRISQILLLTLLLFSDPVTMAALVQSFSSTVLGVFCATEHKMLICFLSMLILHYYSVATWKF
jgi:hypothetical protein